MSIQPEKNRHPISKTVPLVIACFLLVAAGSLLIVYLHRKNASQSAVNKAIDTLIVANSQKDSAFYLPSVIQLHNKPADCWVTVNNVVYNITSLMQEHLDYGIFCGSNLVDIVGLGLNNTNIKTTVVAEQTFKTHKIGQVSPQYAR